MATNNHTFHYTPLFCEENIWKLLQSIYTNISLEQTVTPIDVLLIINRLDSIALFNQKRSTAHLPAIWDYHVILSARIDEKIVIYDFDSACPLPVAIDEYFESTFPSHIQLKDSFQPYLRVVNAERYYKQFTSDRSHMTGIIPENQFPDYEIIKPQKADDALTLQMYKDIDFNLNDTRILNPRQYLLESLNKK